MFTYSFSVPGACEAGKRARDYYTWWNLYQIQTSGIIKIGMKRHWVKDWPISRVCLLIQSTLTRVNTNTLLHVVEFMWPSNVVVVL